MWANLFGKRGDGPAPVRLAQLRAQVFSSDYHAIKIIEQTRSPLAVRPLSDGLVEAIVEDLPGGERIVSWDVLERHNLERGALFSLARRQSAAVETKIHSQLIDDTVEVLVSNGFYLSGAMLELFGRRNVGKGVLFVPLSAHHWCVHEITVATVAPHVQLLALIGERIAAMMEVTPAERLATDVYWYRPDREIVRVGKDATPELARVLG